MKKNKRARAPFTDGAALMPQTMAVDAMPMAGDGAAKAIRPEISVRFSLDGGRHVRFSHSADEPEEG